MRLGETPSSCYSAFILCCLIVLKIQRLVLNEAVNSRKQQQKDFFLLVVICNNCKNYNDSNSNNNKTQKNCNDDIKK